MKTLIRVLVFAGLVFLRGGVALACSSIQVELTASPDTFIVGSSHETTLTATVSVSGIPMPQNVTIDGSSYTLTNGQASTTRTVTDAIGTHQYTASASSQGQYDDDTVDVTVYKMPPKPDDPPVCPTDPPSCDCGNPGHSTTSGPSRDDPVNMASGTEAYLPPLDLDIYNATGRAALISSKRCL